MLDDPYIRDLALRVEARQREQDRQRLRESAGRIRDSIDGVTEVEVEVEVRDPYASLKRNIRRQVRTAIAEARFQASVAEFGETVRTARARPQTRLIAADAAIPAAVTRWAASFAHQLGIRHRVRLTLLDGMQREGIAAAHQGGAHAIDGSFVAIDRGRLRENMTVTDGRHSVTVNAAMESLSHELLHARFPRWNERQVRAAVQAYWLRNQLPYQPQ